MFVLNNSSETQTSLLVGEIEGIKICNNLVALVYTPSNLHLEAGSAPATAFGSGISSGESDEPGIKFSCSDGFSSHLLIFILQLKPQFAERIR